MDDKLRKQVEGLFRSLELTELSISEGDFSLTLKKEVPAVEHASQTVLPIYGTVPQGYVNNTPAAAAEENEQTEAETGKVVRAPLLGTFYSCPEPGADPFVRIGDKVHAGDTLCLIEAMKMMNEIKATEDGTVTDICAENGKMVEFEQVLFRLA